MHRGSLRLRVVGLIAGLLLLCGTAWAQAPSLIPPQGLSIPATTTTLGAAQAMASPCPAGQFLTQITDTFYTCTPQGLPGASSITDSMLANPYSGVGACAGGMFVSTLNRNAPPTCTAPPGGGGFTAGGDLSGTSTSQTVIGIQTKAVPTPASGYLHYNGASFLWDTPSGGSGYPSGAPPQIGGYSATNVSEAETLGGDATLTRSSAGNYSITITKTNGTAFGALATLGVGTGLTSSSGNLNLTTPVSIANGGRGSSTAPAIGQIDIASSTTAFTPVTMSNDCTISSAGAITCTKTNGVAFTALATASVPLSVANGGLGSGTAPTSAQVLVAQSATSYTPQTLGGDATISTSGSLTVTKTSGTAFTALATAAVPLSVANGGEGNSTAPTAGQFRVAASATSVPPVSMSGDCTLASTGAVTCTKTNGTSFTALATAAVPLSIANGGTNTSTAPSAGQVLVAQSGTAYAPVSVSGDETMTTAGVTTNTGLKGVAVPTLAAGYLQYTGSAFAWTTPSGGSGYPSGAPPQIGGYSATNTSEAETLGGDGTLSRTGANAYSLTVTKTSGTAFTTAATTAIGTSGATIPLLSTANTWTLAQTYPASGIILQGSSTGTTTFTSANASATNYTITFPANTGTLAELGLAQSWTALQTFSNGGTFSGTITMPDSSTVTSAGYNSVKALGIGATASAANTLLINNTSSSSVYWGSTTTTPTAAIHAYGGTSAGWEVAAGGHYSGTAWVADATSASLIGQNIGPSTIYFSVAPVLTIGGSISWSNMALIDGAGIGVTHFHNDDSAVAAPTVTNGTIMGGSRDTFGYILASAWPVTITWGKTFTGNPGCVMNGGAGAPGVFSTNAQSTTSIQISCVAYVGGPACTPSWFQYMCFDVY